MPVIHRRPETKRSPKFDRNSPKFDYNNKNGFLTAVWGPSLWHLLHIISLNYPAHPTEADQKHYYDFFMSLRHVLPCRYCRENLEANMKATDFSRKVFGSRSKLSRWVYRLHREVNRRLKKPNTQSFSELRDLYEHFRARCSAKKGTSKKEKGCTHPLNNVKCKGLITIVPQEMETSSSLIIHPHCLGRNSGPMVHAD